MVEKLNSEWIGAQVPLWGCSLEMTNTQRYRVWNSNTWEQRIRLNTHTYTQYARYKMSHIFFGNPPKRIWLLFSPIIKFVLASLFRSDRHISTPQFVVLNGSQFHKQSGKNFLKAIISPFFPLHWDLFRCFTRNERITNLFDWSIFERAF